MPKVDSTKHKSKRKTPVKKSAKLGPIFGGCPEEEIRLKTLPDDLIKPHLQLLFVGINPGLYSAYRGHFYSKKGNHFWPCLVRSGLVPTHFGPDNDRECLEHGIGLTDIVSRCTRSQAELSNDDFAEGVVKLRDKIIHFNPMLVVFNGKGIFAKFVGKKLKDVEYGVQSLALEGCVSKFYVMTSTSPLNAHFPTVESRMFFYDEIKSLLLNLRKSPYFAVNETKNKEIDITDSACT